MIFDQYNIMNYNLDDIQKVKRGQVDFDVKIGMRYGEMPPEALMSKFEVTNDNIDCDEAYGYYARETLTDRTPDTPTFAHEEQRRSFRGKDYLTLLHEGSRGGTEFIGQPEAFLELTERDPRGIATDPDYKQLKRQHEARMRFVRFSADADHSITGGGWNEGQVQEAKQKLFKEMKPRLRIFSTSFDGRREGLRRMWQIKSEISKVSGYNGTADGYGDAIKDYALNPQRATQKLSNEVLRNQRMYQLATPDNLFTVARYGDAHRTARRLAGAEDRMTTTDSDYVFDDADVAACAKHAGFLMGKIVNQKHAAEADTEHGKQTESAVRKNEMAAAKHDLTVIMRDIQQDADVTDGDQTLLTKTAPLKRAKHLKNEIEVNHLTPAHVYVDGSLMYKAVKPGADVGKIRENMVVDPADPRICELLKESRTKYGKNAPRNTDPSARYSINEVYGKMMQTHSYKHGRADMNTNMKNTLVDEPYAVAPERRDASGMVLGDDDSQIRGPSHANYTNPEVAPAAVDAVFSDNTSKERHLGPMGDKFSISRYTLRENNTDRGVADLS